MKMYLAGDGAADRGEEHIEAPCACGGGWMVKRMPHERMLHFAGRLARRAWTWRAWTCLTNRATNTAACATHHTPPKQA